jgi:hypothetical protein
MAGKSPSGSACPYYYMGGELHPLKYGSFHADKEKLFETIQAEERFILRSPGHQNRRIWIDLYETRLDDDVAATLARHIRAIEPKIQKLCFVGCSPLAAWRIRRHLARLGLPIAGQVKFFSDPELAKMWLVREPEK